MHHLLYRVLGSCFTATILETLNCKALLQSCQNINLYNKFWPRDELIFMASS